MRWFLVDMMWNDDNAEPPIECAGRAHAEAMYHMGDYQGKRMVYAYDEKRKVGCTILWHDIEGKARSEDWAPWTKHIRFLEDYLKPETRKVNVDTSVPESEFKDGVIVDAAE
jgi:hypothetical protein